MHKKGQNGNDNRVGLRELTAYGENGFYVLFND